MFSSFPSLRNPFSVPRFLRPTSKSIDIPSVSIHDVETTPDKRARTLKHLLKLNHAQHAIIYHNLKFHNHMPHILGSAYILNGTSDHLQEIYDRDSKSLEPWRDSPGEISDFDWRDYLGDPRYQRGYVDFFEDQLVQNGYDWKDVVNKYLFEGKEPLFNNLISGLGHPLIHLGYAYELSSREIAMEALGLVACFYNFMHVYLDDAAYSRPPYAPSPTPPPPSDSPVKPSTSTLDILRNIRRDDRFSSLPSHPGAISLRGLFQDKTYEQAILEHWNSWLLPPPFPSPAPSLTEVFLAAQRTPTALLIGTKYPEEGAKEHDFFLVHLLTTSHAVRILLPLIEPEHHIPLVRQWWLFVCAVYVAQGRPEVDTKRFEDIEVGGEGGKGWNWVTKQAVEGKWRLDAHFVKAVRAMKVAAETEGKDDEEYYLKAAVKMCEEFDRGKG